jgi:hypothetical protein
MTKTEAVQRLTREGELILFGTEASVANAVAIRQEAKTAGLQVTYRSYRRSGQRVVELQAH